jgi:predicted Zn-dependent peptidase
MKENFKRIVLENGFTIIFEKRETPSVSVAFAVRNGGANETCEEKGISHYIEHMLYKGTPTRNVDQIAFDIEKKGGILNGFTSEEITAYWCKMPSKHLKVALEILGDMVKNPLFDEKELDKERKVILEEIKMYRDNPRDHAFESINKALYEGTMGMFLAGTPETMNSFDKKKMVEKFKEVYTPNNMILSVVGDANFDELVDFVKENFGDEKGVVPEREIELKNDIVMETRKDIDQANLVFGFHTPLASDSLSSAAKVLMGILIGGMSSRLFKEVREKRNLAYAIKGFPDIGKRFSRCLIYAGTMKENVEKIKKVILEEFGKVSEGLEEKELNEVKEQMIGSHQISLEDSQDQMVHLLGAEIEGNAKDFYDFEKNIELVKLEDVKVLAKKVAEGDYSFYALVPEDK